MCVCTHVRAYVHVCHSSHMKARRKRVGISVLLPPCGSWGLNSGGQDGHQGPLTWRTTSLVLNGYQVKGTEHLGRMAHVCNPSTQVPETKFLSLRLAWAVTRDPILKQQQQNRRLGARCDGSVGKSTCPQTLTLWVLSLELIAEGNRQLLEFIHWPTSVPWHALACSLSDLDTCAHSPYPPPN